MEKAKTLLKQLSFFQRIVIINGVGASMYPLMRKNNYKASLFHIYLTLVPVLLCEILVFSRITSQENSPMAALMMVVITIPFFFLFHYSGRSMVLNNQFIRDHMDGFRKIYYSYLVIYYLIMAVVAFFLYWIFY